MDFFQICTREIERGPKKGELEVYPDFIVGRSKDLMVRGKSFYAIWDEEQGLWSTDEYDVQRLVDAKLREFAEKNGIQGNVKYMRSFKSNGWVDFRRFLANVSDNSKQLDTHLAFANTETKKSDYVSRRLSYQLAPGDCSAWDEMVGTLYSPEERAKIEWAIGAVISGDSKKIEKFLVLYGPPGAGKGTILKIIQKLFDGYTTTFDAKALGSNSNGFATEVFKSNPLVAIQHDGDLSKIEDNTRLNMIISHEDMVMNEKHKPQYTARVNAFLFMGTNKPVKISDAKSGIIRRLIDVHPSGNKLQPNHYHTVMSRIDFELGAIAQHCLDVYRDMGKNYYNGYQPLEMMLQTDIFFNFIEAHFDIFKHQDGVSLQQAYALYKEFCAETGIEKPLPRYKVRAELANYFDEFHDRITIDGEAFRSYYAGFNARQFKTPTAEPATIFSLVMDETKSLFDLLFAESAAQLANDEGFPRRRWATVKTTLAETDTSQVHYVKVPENHIVIDFDLKDEDGNKSLERNLEAASEWPATYAELSKSGGGVHLHYNYDGDVSELSRSYADGIEVKVYSGDASLRRRLTKCNAVPIATLVFGQLPLKEKKKVLQMETIKSEKGLRDLIERNLRKEIHPGTKSSIDFISHILDEAYKSDLQYDVSDLRGRLIAFANNSTNQPLVCLKTVMAMNFKSSDKPDPFGLQPTPPEEVPTADDRLVFFDVEVYSNLFVVCWKYEGSDTVVSMVNPTPQDIEKLFRFKLVGFNNRRYDNHILYARYLGYDNEQLYKLSQKIIDGVVGALFGEAYNLSYTDIYDYSSKKQGLKKFQIELGIQHKEMDIPWEKPVPKERIQDVVEYCCNDVRSTEEVHRARKGDYTARLILSALSGLSPNDTTQKHTARIIFGEDRNPQSSFIYTNLAKEFPGYVFERGKSTYRDETVGEGGYVYAEPGIHRNVALLDVASMHPTSIGQLRLFGEYTPRFMELVDAQLAIKHGDFDGAKGMLGGKLAPYLDDIQRLEDPSAAKSSAATLRYALKIAINIVYGLTSAKFDNPFRDIRNVDNIVAKRGALFMIDLKHAVQEQGFTVAHIKTDSIKIPDATPEIIEFVKQFGAKYGYTFEHEATYAKMALVNDAVYIARKDECINGEWVVMDENEQMINYEAVCSGELRRTWSPVGAQFQHPYVFKTLFDLGGDLGFDDFCETKSVTQGSMHLDFNCAEKPKYEDGDFETMQFVGRTGRFVPVREGFGGGILWRIKDEKAYAVAGTKGYLWLEADLAKDLPVEAIDMSYFERLADEARKTIEKYGDFEEFLL